MPVELCPSLSPSLNGIISNAMENLTTQVESCAQFWDPLLALCSQDSHISIFDPRIVLLNTYRLTIEFVEKILEFSFMCDMMTFEAHIVEDKTKLFYRRYVSSGSLSSAKFLEFISNVLHDILFETCGIALVCL